jgi:hypothetical protein
MSDEKPKRSQCPACHLFTLLTYPHGHVECQNYACSLHRTKAGTERAG